MADGIWVVVGLGNPGPRYEATRHNIGFRLVDRLAALTRAGAEETGPNYRVRRGRSGETELILVKPMTYMNRSGDALARLPESAAAGAGRHLVVLDDVSLPFGAIRFRPRGSDGGHRGLRSVIDGLGTLEVPRLRLGVGDGDPGRDLAEYVLEPFSSAEEAELEEWLRRAAEGVRAFVDEGPEAAMNRFNR